MQNLLLPPELNRKAIAANFDRLTPCAWEKLFEKEKHNGLFELRVVGPDYAIYVHYSTAGLISWLIRNHRYSLAEIRDRFYEPAPIGPRVKQHILAG